jgi:hypothetical protein
VFADSFVYLYHKSGEAVVEVGAAERRLMEYLRNEGGIPNETVRSGPEAIAAAVAARFGYAGAEFADDLKAAREAEYSRLSAKSALELVRRLDRHIVRLKEKMRNGE